jgi:hypothetical protein
MIVFAHDTSSQTRLSLRPRHHHSIRAGTGKLRMDHLWHIIIAAIGAGALITLALSFALRGK